MAFYLSVFQFQLIFSFFYIIIVLIVFYIMAKFTWLILFMKLFLEFLVLFLYFYSGLFWCFPLFTFERNFKKWVFSNIRFYRFSEIVWRSKLIKISGKWISIFGRWQLGSKSGKLTCTDTCQFATIVYISVFARCTFPFSVSSS